MRSRLRHAHIPAAPPHCTNLLSIEREGIVVGRREKLGRGAERAEGGHGKTHHKDSWDCTNILEEVLSLLLPQKRYPPELLTLFTQVLEKETVQLAG